MMATEAYAKTTNSNPKLFHQKLKKMKLLPRVMKALPRVADGMHKFVGLGLICFTVVGSLNLMSMFEFKQRRNKRAQELLEQETL